MHYRVGKKIGEGSFGVIFEGTNLLNNQLVAIKFARPCHPVMFSDADFFRNRERAMLRNYGMSTGRTRFLSDAVSAYDEIEKRLD